MRRIFPARILRSDFARYVAVSLAAFVLDLALLSTCLRLFDLGLALSATIGFTAGAVLAYVLSARWVFRFRAYAQAPGFEFAAFVAIGLAGLGVTQLVLWIGVVWFALVPELVKLAAAGASFAFNYALRKSLLFVARPRAAATRESAA
jgi:putative flippase GtrA